MKIVALTVAATLALTSIAAAGEFDGVWSENPESCDPDFVVEIRGANWGSTHGLCSVVARNGSELSFSCYMEEMQLPVSTSLVTLSGNNLVEVTDGVTTTYTRCPD